jgi:hypothetical protein
MVSVLRKPVNEKDSSDRSRSISKEHRLDLLEAKPEAHQISQETSPNNSPNNSNNNSNEKSAARKSHIHSERMQLILGGQDEGPRKNELGQRGKSTERGHQPSRWNRNNLNTERSFNNQTQKRKNSNRHSPYDENRDSEGSMRRGGDTDRNRNDFETKTTHLNDTSHLLLPTHDTTLEPQELISCSSTEPEIEAENRKSPM